jgi:hypothetical protein
MKCEESLILLEEYFDGELDDETAGMVSAHVASCLVCKAEVQQLSFEDRVYQKYERGVEPSAELWAGVRARIAEEAPLPHSSVWERWQLGISNLLSVRFNLAFSAALVFSAVIGTVAVMKYLDKGQTPGPVALVPDKPAETKPTIVIDPKPPTPAATSALAGVASKGRELRRSITRVRPASAMAVKPDGLNENSAGSKTPSQLVRAAEQNYLSAIAMLTRDVKQRPAQIDTETRAKLDGALASIDRTILATRKAVRKNPNDPMAVQYMLTAYARKVDVLKEMTNY